MSVPVKVKKLLTETYGKVFLSRSEFEDQAKAKRTAYIKLVFDYVTLWLNVHYPLRLYAEGSKAYRVWDCEEERLVTTRTVKLDEHPPSLYTNTDGNNLNYSPNRQVVFIFDENMPESPRGSRRVESNTNDVVMEDVAETIATDHMEVDEEGEPTALVPTSMNSPAVMERGRTNSQELQRSNFHHNELAHSTARRPGQSVQVLDRPEPPRSIVLHSERENRIVFSGVPRRTSASQRDRPHLLENGDAALSREIPLLTSEPHSTISAEGDDDVSEPESKRPRLDEYEIALSAAEVPQSYAKAMASSEAKYWKEAIRSEIRSHVRNHLGPDHEAARSKSYRVKVGVCIQI
ncbi:unnamed protein product [Phytophthora lilii]|uniref:Unnamed protein product n=1 Tax=Phytophthora lilii TaxID=2077276 RepID=A0A9W6WUQ7_9STRA|nr:unnamed protein product [Phytophthora lilii]